MQFRILESTYIYKILTFTESTQKINCQIVISTASKFNIETQNLFKDQKVN